MRAQYVAPVVTPYSLEQMEYAVRVGLTAAIGRRPSDQAIAVAMAKLRLESGNGQHVWNHNLGNVKCSPTAPGNYTCICLNEVIGGKLKWFAPEGELIGGRGSPLKNPPLEVPDGEPQTRMQSRAGMTDAGYFYADFIFSNKRYFAAGEALLAGNPEAYSRELSRAGYYTAPVEQYTATMMKLYAPSLALVQNRKMDQPAQPSRDEFYNQLLLDGFVEAEYAHLQDELNRGSGHAMRDYDDS